MNKLLRKLAWCQIPFTYGSAIESDEDRKSHRLHSDVVKFVRFNGMISSIQMFIALITVSFAITLSVYLSAKFDGTVNLLALIVYMILGLVAMFVFNVHRDRVLVPTIEEGGNRDNLTLIGITIFYVLGCLLDMFNTITSISCDGVWRICNDGYIYVSYVTEIIFHILRIAYLGGETMFCISFNRSTFSDKPLTRYGLMFLQAVNISLWFDALVHESGHKFTAQPRMSRFSRRCLADNMNVSVEVIDCVYHNNTLYHMAKTYVSPTFLPFTIEFTLLAGECLCHWFFHCASSIVLANSDASDTRVVYTDSGIAEDDVDSIREEQKPHESLPASTVSGDFDSSEEDSEETRPLLQNTDQPSRTSMCKSDFVLVIIILLNVLLGVLAILPKVPGLQGVPHYQNLFSSYLFVFWLCMTASMAVGYQVSRGFRYDRKATFGGLDYLLLLSSVGPLAFDTFTLIALFGQLQQHHHPNATIPNLNNSASTGVTLSLELCNAFDTYFQVAFSLFAGRIILSSTNTTSSKAAIFKCVILFLAVANGSLWLVSTFNAFETGRDLQVNYFGVNGWAIINNVVTPLSLFFRFNSCILFTRLYMRLRRDNDKSKNTTATTEHG